MITVTKAWTLTQPWATLMAVGAKLNETRGMHGMPNFTGWVAIHSSATYPIEAFGLEMVSPFEGALVGEHPLPLGQVLAVCRVIGVCEVEKVHPPLTEQERAFGDYTPGIGRRAFITTGVRRLREPFACRGMLGLWNLPRAITDEDLL